MAQQIGSNLGYVVSLKCYYFNFKLFCVGHSLLPEDCAIETLARTLQVVHELSRMQMRDVPRHLIVIMDNTAKSAKNSIFTMFLLYLVLHGHFSSACYMSFMVGHTHEDIDQMFVSSLCHHYDLLFHLELVAMHAFELCNCGSLLSVLGSYQDHPRKCSMLEYCDRPA